MKNNTLFCVLAAAVVAVAAPGQAPAQTPQASTAGGWTPGGASVQLARTRDGTEMVTLGLQWYSGWRHDWWGGQLSYGTEALLGHWRVDGAGGRESYTHVALLPMLRNHFDGGRSRWFIEGGIGVSLTDNVYRSRDKQFSTAFNFVDVVGMGYHFGATRGHELGLRVIHVSNANIKKPNPGTDALSVRYAYRF